MQKMTARDQSSTMTVRHLLSLNDLSKEEISLILQLALKMKESPRAYEDHLRQKTLIMLFQKTSTRTRLSFEAGMTQLGGHGIYVDWRTSNFTLGSLQDETRCLDRYGDIIMARVYKHKDLEDMAAVSLVPVINGLSELYHPCQGLADLLTILEKLGSLEGKKIVYVGDGNNVCHSLLLGCTKMGMEVVVAGPKDYWPDAEIVQLAKTQGSVVLTEDPKEAVQGADVVYTDTWVSMGQEEETKKRLADFEGYQVNAELLGGGGALIMHCLPAHRGHEISDDAIDSSNSVVFDQAENRMHAQKALMSFLLGQ